MPETIDGVISSARALERGDFPKGIPAVNINSQPVADTWQVCTDNRAVCKLAFDHLYDRQIRQFCYLQHWWDSVSESRLDSFKEIVEAASCPCTAIAFRKRNDYLHGHIAIADKLRNLPHPLGILIPRDEFAPPVFNACKELGHVIPDDVAVVSVNNTISICMSTDPELSSIEQDAESIGYEALKLTARLVKGEDVPKDPIVVPPRQLIMRGSSARSHRQNQNIVAVIDYMLANIREPVVLEDLIRQQSLSQRVFERRFKSETGMTPMRYLRHLRIERAKHLLETTDMKVVEIAEQVGVPDPNHLCALFRQHVKMSPLAYRSAKTGQ